MSRKGPTRHLDAKRRDARAPAAAVVVPELTPCPGCGVTLQAGAGPHGLVWHGCERPPGSLEVLEAWLVRRIHQQVLDGEVTTIDAVSAVAKLKRGGNPPGRPRKAASESEEPDDDADRLAVKRMLGIVPKRLGR